MLRFNFRTSQMISVEDYVSKTLQPAKTLRATNDLFAYVSSDFMLFNNPAAGEKLLLEKEWH